MNQLSFRSSRIVYYGPQICYNCGVNVCKMGHEFGGNTFNYPEGPIYPNTEWFPHVCDPKAAGYRLQHAPGTVAYTREVGGVFEAVLYTDQQRCDAERDAAAVAETNRIAEEARLASLSEQCPYDPFLAGDPSRKRKR